MLCLGVSFFSFSQVFKENKAQAHQLRSIEAGIVKNKSDNESLKLIGDEKNAKTSKDAYVKNVKGYGAAAVSAEKMIKFRQKLSKSDEKYQALLQAQLDASTKKREYISTTDSIYNSIYSKIVVEKAAHGSKK